MTDPLKNVELTLTKREKLWVIDIEIDNVRGQLKKITTKGELTALSQKLCDLYLQHASISRAKPSQRFKS